MSTNHPEKFTVVIPTRERCDTLESALKTCSTQDYDNLEIIVSDNFSQDRTKEVVQSFRDDRIRYINTGKRLSMSGNWEFALSHVNGGYVMYIGDDDGLLPDAIKNINRIIQDTKCEALAWSTVDYQWPDATNTSHDNLIRIPLRGKLIKRDYKSNLLETCNFRSRAKFLPTIYRGAINYRAIKRAMDSSGRFFFSCNPDIYSAIALGFVLNSFYFSERPYAMGGVSRHSTGFSLLGYTTNREPMDKFLNEDNIPFHDALVLAPSFPILIAESFLQASRIIKSAQDYKINIKELLTAAIINAVPNTPNTYESIIRAVMTIARNNNLEAFASDLIQDNKNAPVPLPKPTYGYNIIRRHVLLNGSDYGVKNVYDASLLSSEVLNSSICRYFSRVDIAMTTVRLISRFISRRFKRLMQSLRCRNSVSNLPVSAGSIADSCS